MSAGEGSLQTPALPYLLDQRWRLWLRGRWKKGGVLEFYFDDELADVVNLPPAKWCLAALLVDAAQSATSWVRAFRSAVELSRALAKRSGHGNSDPGNLIRSIHKLRTLLGASSIWSRLPDAKETALERGHELIEYHDYLGYRLSLPPSQLHLEVIDGPAPLDAAGG